MNARELLHFLRADEPAGEELAPLVASYLARFPDGAARRRWRGITYVRVRPHWLRYGDFRAAPPVVLEIAGEALRAFVASRART